MMKWNGMRISLILSSIYLIAGSWLMSGVESESVSGPFPASSVFPSQRPIINYRTKVQGVRYGEAVPASSSLATNPTRLALKSHEDQPKTEFQTHQIFDDDDEYEEESSVPEFTTNNPNIQSSSTTYRIPSIPNALKRNFAFLTATTTPTPTPTTPEPKSSPKTKSTRRRKVKRPIKSKSTTSRSTGEDLGNPETSKDGNGSSSSSGDKSLALEIGSQDGKYTLINHFFGNTSDGGGTGKRPGIISYAPSNDFSGDNDQSLGKLEENDIWLSEGHLLVLKGGDFDSTSRDKWGPIDNYQRDKSKPPLRIPLDTDNPPPFPIFINKTGPPIFLGPPPPFPIPGYGEFNESFDPSRLPPPGLIPLFPNGSIPEFFGPPGGFPPHHPFPPPGNNSFRPPGLTGPPGGGGLYGNGGPPGGVYGQPRPNNGTFPPPPFPFPFPPPPPPGGKNGSFQPPPPFFPFGPPGGPNGGQPPPGFNPGGPFFPPLVLNPKDNETDDPSIFLPPPYDFDYYEDNTTIVPPGPFAPGLVVPPPKDFYVVYNKTRATTIFPSLSTSSTPRSAGLIPGSVSIKPQRPNAKRPKFPITTTPVDDSLEENLPPTTPSLLFPKKRKQGRGKSGKSYSSSKESSEEVNNGNGGKSLSTVTVTQTPRIILRHQVSPTPSPLNYVYVRGKLKTLAEIAAEAAAAEGGFDKRNPTPIPAFDELGYPNRNLGTDPPPPPEYEFPKKKKNPRKQQSPHVYFTGQQGHRQVSPADHGNSHQEISPIFPSSNPPSVYTLNNPQHQYPQNDQSQGLFYPTNPFIQLNQNLDSVGPTYFTPIGVGSGRDETPAEPNNQQQQQQIYHQPYYTTQQQPSPTAPTQSLHPEFHQSTFSPPLPVAEQRKRPRSRVIFPDDQNRRARFQEVHPTPQIYNNPLLYQALNPQGQLGYYSPVSQYRTTLSAGSGQFIPNTFYQNPGSSGQSGTFTTQFLHPQIQQQQQQPSYQQQQQQYQQQLQQQYQQQQLQQQYQQQPQNTYYNVQQLPQQDGGQAVPLHSDILVNYREPLPPYNTESESIATRSVLKAGPSTSGTFGTQPTGEGSSAAQVVQAQGNFYSFERGGPGGFSYKIRL